MSHTNTIVKYQFLTSYGGIVYIRLLLIEIGITVRYIANCIVYWGMNTIVIVPVWYWGGVGVLSEGCSFFFGYKG